MIRLTPQLKSGLGSLIRSQVWEDVCAIAEQEMNKANISKSTSGCTTEFEALRKVIFAEGQEAGIRQLITIIQQYAGTGND